MAEVISLLERDFENKVACGIMAGLEEVGEDEWIAVSRLLVGLHCAGVLSVRDKRHEDLFNRTLDLLISQEKVVRNDEKEVTLPPRDPSRDEGRK